MIKRLAFIIPFLLFTLSCGVKQQSDKDIKVVLVTQERVFGDNSFNSLIWKGITDYFQDPDEKLKGKNYDIVTCKNVRDIQDVLVSAAQKEPDLIITPSYSFVEPMKQVSKQFPQQKFAILDIDRLVYKNILQIVFCAEEGSYLAGLTAALKLQEDGVKNPSFGFIGGVPGPNITRFEMGYIQGVKSVFPDAKITDYYTRDFANPKLAYNKAFEWYQDGVNVIYCAAGLTGSGAIDMAKKTRAGGKNVWVVGVDIDQYEEGIYDTDKSVVLTSMIKKVDVACSKVIKSIAENNCDVQTFEFSLKDDSMDFSKRNPQLSQDIVEKVEQAKQKIIAGEITVLATYASCIEAGFVTQGLEAKD